MHELSYSRNVFILPSLTHVRAARAERPSHMLSVNLRRGRGTCGGRAKGATKGRPRGLTRNLLEVILWDSGSRGHRVPHAVLHSSKQQRRIREHFLLKADVL